MVQLSDTKETSKAGSTLKKSAKSPVRQTSAETSLGYEVLYGRRSSTVQVPLSVQESNSRAYPSTGSALLDSFVSEAIAEPIPLRHLRLVNVANQRTQHTPHSRKAASTQPKGLVTKAPTDSPQADTARVNQTNITASSTASKPVGRTTAPSAETPSSPVLPVPLPRAAKPVGQPAPSTAPNPLLEQPPAAAEPDRIPLTAKQQKSPPAKPPSTSGAPTFANSAKPTENKSSTPSSAPAVATSRLKPIVSDVAPADSKLARDSAAAVGLIDINDTLLFGGDHQNLASSDPFIDESTQPENDTGVLGYLSQQVSAFTVSKLKSGFPNNTDPRVINRPDPPKHRTVLDLQTFKLGALDEESITRTQTEASAQTQLTAQQTAQTPEINILSQQVNALNQKIAELSQKLAQVTQAQTSA